MLHYGPNVAEPVSVGNEFLAPEAIRLASKAPRLGTNTLTRATGTRAVGAPWWTQAVTLNEGTNVIIVSGTNSVGEIWSDSFWIYRNANWPFVNTTNTPVGGTTVLYAVTTYNVRGTNNVYTVGRINWTNALTGVGATMALGSQLWNGMTPFLANPRMQQA